LISLKTFDFRLKKIEQNSKKIKEKSNEFKHRSFVTQSKDSPKRVGVNIIVSTCFFETVAPCRVQISDFKRPINPCGNISFISLQKCTDNHAGTLKMMLQNQPYFVTKTAKSFDFRPHFFKENQRNQTLRLSERMMPMH